MLLCLLSLISLQWGYAVSIETMSKIKLNIFESEYLFLCIDASFSILIDFSPMGLCSQQWDWKILEWTCLKVNNYF